MLIINEVLMLLLKLNMLVSFVFQHPSQQHFSHVRMESLLPKYKPVIWHRTEEKYQTEQMYSLLADLCSKRDIYD